MKKYPLNKYTIKYDSAKQFFYLIDQDGKPVGKSTNGRELGRDAWELGAEEVIYNYDLGIDENMPLIPKHAKHKTRS